MEKGSLSPSGDSTQVQAPQITAQDLPSKRLRCLGLVSRCETDHQ